MLYLSMPVGVLMLIRQKNNTISVKHNLSSGDSAYADTDATGLILGGSIKERKADKKYGAATASSVIVGAQNALASNDNSVVVGGLDNVASGANSTVVGGDNNKASGNQSAVFGGRDNTASGITSTASGGIMNVANGQNSTAVGGTFNYALGTGATSVGGYGKDYTTGYNSSVNGSYSVGIAGGSTGDKADYSLAAGRQAVVTTENGTAIGYQATTDEANTIAFGHDAGDVSGYTINWKQLPKGQTNADGTTNDYTQAPESVTENTYTKAAYNRLVKVADGVEDHDVVVMKQLKQYAEKNAGNIGNNIKVYKTDENGNIQLGDDKKPSVDETATTKAKNDSKDAWGKALGAKTEDMPTSTAASNSDQLITGKTLYNYDKPNADGTYVKLNQTTGQNLSALDSQVAKNTTKLDDENHNIKYYSVKDKTPDDKLLPSIPGYLNDKNDGAKGAGSMAAGFNTHADGVASTVAGSYSGVVGTGLQGAAALSYGTFNVNQNAAQAGTFSGVANSIVGQANVTTDSNAAIIYGAGNTVKNSYREIDTKNASEIMAAARSRDVKKLSEALQKAVPASGGQVMVMGGGNVVDNAYMSQVTGVGNTVTGSGEKYDKDSSTQLNYVDGFYTTLENGKNDYIIGSHNTVTGTSTETNQSNIVFGDNHTLTNTKNNIILGSLDAASEATVSDVVSIGHNAKVSAEGGVAIGSGSEATTEAGVAGYDPTGATADTTAAWTSKKAAVSVGTSDATRQINGVAAGTNDTDAVNVAQLKKLNGMKANVDASNLTDANVSAWQTKLGNGTVAANNAGLVTGDTVYKETRVSATDAEGNAKTYNYISADNTAGANLESLDTHVKTNADQIGTNTKNITDLTNLSNITTEGENVIKNLSKGSIGMENGSHTTVSKRDVNGVDTYKVDVNVDGKVEKDNANIVSGGTVYSALQDVQTKTDTDLAGKANVDASNLTDANVSAWQTKLGNGTVAANNAGLVTGDTVYKETRVSATDAEGNAKTYNYISADNTAGANLESLDTHVKTNADQIGTNTKNITDLTNLSNITTEGENVIKNLSKGSIGMENGSHTTVSKRDVNGVDTYKVDVSVDGEVKEGNSNIVSGGTVYSALQDAQTKMDGDLAGKANVNASNIGSNITVDPIYKTDDNGKKVIDQDATDAAAKKAQTENANAWGTAIGTGTVAKDNGQLVTGKTVYDALHGGLDDLVIGHAGKDGKDGQDGSIGLVGQTGKKGEDGKNAFATTIIKTEKGVDGVDGKNGKDGITRIVYNDTNNPANKHTVATLDDGMKYAGDTGTVANVKLNHQLKLSGTTFNDKDKKYDANSWTSDNIAVVSSAADETTGDAMMYLKLNKDLNLTDKGSVRFGDKNSSTTLDASGLTIKSTVTKEGKTEVVNGPSMTKDGIDGGSKAITNIGSGIEKDDKGNYTDKSKSSAANIGDVQTIVNDAKKELTDGTNGLNSKANVDASNIGKNLKEADGRPASIDAVKTNKDAWASAIGTNEVKEGNMQLVTSDAVARELAKKADKSYVDQELGKKADKTYVDEKLDTKANKSDVYTKTEVDSKVTAITNGLDGKAGKDLDNISEKGKTVIKKLSKDAVQIEAGTAITVDGKVDETTGNKTYTISANNNGKVAKDDGNLISGVTLYNEVHVDKDGTYIKSKDSATGKDMTVAQNLSALDSGLKTTSDLIHTNTAGDTIQIGGNSTATRIDVNGKDGKGRVITGVVSDANDPNSAANVGYVNDVTAANTQQVYRDMNRAYGSLNNNINRAAAGSNALAALHPLDFDPADKASFAVGYGHYRNANAAAVGAFYQPNANTMVNMGISLGNGDPGFNAGVSFKIGKGSAYNGVSKAEMAQTIHDQATEISAIKADDAAKDKRIDALEKENQEMKKQIQEILARLNG